MTVGHMMLGELIIHFITSLFAETQTGIGVDLFGIHKLLKLLE